MVAPALERVRSIGPVFRSREAVAAGVSWRDLYALRDAGHILELSRGLFQVAESAGVANIDFLAVCARARHGMIAMESALSYWDLTDEIPSAVHLAVPEGLHRPVIDHPPTVVHVFRTPAPRLDEATSMPGRSRRLQATPRPASARARVRRSARPVVPGSRLG